MANDAQNPARPARIQPDPALLPLLFDVMQALDDTASAETSLQEILQALHTHNNITRGTLQITVFSEIPASFDDGSADTQKLAAAANQTLSDILAQVLKTSLPVIIPDYNHGGLARRGRESTIVAVPIRSANLTIGAIACEWPRHARKDESPQHLATLQATAGLIARVLRIRKEALEERDRLILTIDELRAQVERKFHPSNLIGNSRQMRAVFDAISRHTRSSEPVLIRGLAGTGKELVAHAIHYNSPRASKPFVKVYCSTIPSAQIGRELFGYDGPGGLATQRRGKIELAHGGTLLLDRVSTLSPELQERLVRVLKTGELVRLEGNNILRVDVRVLCTSEQNIERRVEEGTFNAELAQILAPQTILLPTLRERTSDIMLLVDSFIAKYNELHGKNVRRVSTPAIDMLMAYHWPGNIRELENCVEHAVLTSDDGVIHGHQLPPSLQSAEASGTEFTGGLQQSLDNLERELIIDALKSTGGNMARAAKQLGISERIMGLRVKRFGVEARRYKS